MKGYRTLIVAFLTILFGVLAQTDWNVFFDDPKSGGVAIVVGLFMAICRFVTTTPVGHSEHPAVTEAKLAAKAKDNALR